MSVQQEKFKEIADQIRIYTNTSESIKPSEFANKIEDVFSNGERFGRSNQKSESEYIFWSNLQAEGARTNWSYLCYGGYFGNGETFKPRYDMKVKLAQCMFNSNYNSPTIDLRKEALGVEIDWSGCTFFNNTFNYQGVISAIGTLDTRASEKLYDMFQGAKNLHTVERFILKDDGSQTDLNCSGAYSLKNITFEGVIGTNTNFQSSPLTRASIESIIGCLSDTASGKTLTLKKTAKEAAFTEEEWTELTANKTNWTISLV